MTSAVQSLPAGSTNTRSLWAAVTVLGVAVLALGASLVFVQIRPPDGHAALAAPDAANLPLAAQPLPAEAARLPVTAVASDEVVVTEPAAKAAPARSRATAPRSVAVTPPAPLPAPEPAVRYNAPPVVVATAPTPEPMPAPVVITESGPVPSRAIAMPPQRIVCASCGRVEAVTPVERQSTTQGVGAVAGGVLGAVVGNQVGKGSGRALATIIGAIGGGVAGNAIERNVKTETVYQVLVRMDNGSLRTVEQSSMPAIGAAVVVDANTLRLQQPQGSGTGGTPTPRPVGPQPKVYNTDRD